MRSRRGRPRGASTQTLSRAETDDGAAPYTGARQFRVRFTVERVVDAHDIRDALQQAQALGASEIEAITRE